MSELDIASILVIALGLSVDCFAVALSSSISRPSVSLWSMLRAAFAFGAFQVLMPVLGWLAGRTIVDMIAAYDHWVAFALLALVGIKMIRESRRGEADHDRVDITGGFTLLTLSVATSIDALAAGLTFAFLKVNIVLASAVIGMVAFSITMSGFGLGKRAGKFTGGKAEAIGGVLLIAIGLRILLSHIL